MSQKDKATKKAAAQIAKLTDEALNLIRQAEVIAKQHGVTFSFDVAYGMGGTFYGAGYKSDYDPEYDIEQGEWKASSHSC